MTKPQDTRVVQKELRKAGFQSGRTVGSHTTWVHPSGVRITVPDGHGAISAGVYRNIQKAMDEAQKRGDK